MLRGLWPRPGSRFQPEQSQNAGQGTGYTGELNGSAEMNTWLHKATLAELAKNGGMVPAAMLG